MNENKLTLFTRQGCCLCEGLESRLTNLPLDKINPPLDLCVKDIDGVDVSPDENKLYSLEVPVLILELKPLMRKLKLPRVSPRLSEDGLFKWLQKTIKEKI